MSEDILSELKSVIENPTFSNTNSINSVSIQIGDIEFLDYLSKKFPHFYLKSEQEELLTIGKLRTLHSQGNDRFDRTRKAIVDLYNNISYHAKGHPDWIMPRVFGGFTFYDEQPNGIWTDFTSSDFVLPVIQLLRRNNETYLTLNWDTDFDLTLLDDYLSKKVHESPRNTVETVDYPISEDKWNEIIGNAKIAFEGELEKVVLSRVCSITTIDSLDIYSVMTQLRDTYPYCNVFYFQPRSNSRFFGASPEILCNINGDRVETMALAGTTARSADPEEDKKLGNNLLNDTKERYEHSVVVNMIKSELEQFTTEMDFSQQPTLLKLNNVQHLLTRFNAIKRPDVDVFSILERLHPTPALGGKPRGLALQFIRDHEPTSRGMYGAPLGWIDGNLNGSFIIAIRSAINSQNTTWLYAGAGIVEASIADKEWKETELKFNPIMFAIGGN